MQEYLTKDDILKLEKLKVVNTSDVYLYTFKDAIDNSGIAKGYVKKELKLGDRGNPSTEYLQLCGEDDIITEKPRMITRAVTSSRLDEELGLNVLCKELYGQDEFGNTIGISVKVKGRPIIEQIEVGPKKEVYVRLNHFDFVNYNTQKGMHDLHALDYVTGQLDRSGNDIFIDEEGNVKGIDNNIAFGSKKGTHPTHKSNSTCPKGLPVLLHLNTAKAFLKLDHKKLEEILRGKRSDPQKLNKEEIEAAKIRLAELNKHIKQLKKNGGIVGPNKEKNNKSSTEHENSFKLFSQDTLDFVINKDKEKISLPDKVNEARYNSYLSRSVIFYEYGGMGQTIYIQEEGKESQPAACQT